MILSFSFHLYAICEKIGSKRQNCIERDPIHIELLIWYVSRVKKTVEAIRVDNVKLS